jgi:predicted ester cyclase
VSAADQVAQDEVTEVARTYFGATTRRDLDAMEACWKPGGVENIIGLGELQVPGEYRAYFRELFEALPDFKYEVLKMVTEGNRVAVHWQAKGTFTGKPYQGLKPNGKTGRIEGIDMVEVVDGKVVRNDVSFDSAMMMREIGILPAVGSPGERVTKRLFNVRTAALKALGRGR